MTREAFGLEDAGRERAEQGDWFDRTDVQIIEEDGEPIGCLALTEHPDHVFLDRIALLPAAQRRGIGTALIRELMARGRPIRLSVRVDNQAIRLYDRLGFRVTAVEHPRIRMEWTP